MKHLRSSKVSELLELQEVEDNYMTEIHKQDRLLEEQYKVNEECKKRISDRKEKESKEIKLLEEEVQKCKEQVREV